MSKIAVVYWSGTGNTEAMAMAVAQGARDKGAEVSVLTPSEAIMTPSLLAALLWEMNSWKKVNSSQCLPIARAV